MDSQMSSRARRALLAALSVTFLCGLSMVGCGPARRSTKSDLALKIVDPPRRPDMDAILVFLPATGATVEVLDGLREALVEDFDVITMVVGPETTPEKLGTMINAVGPKALVLMNNPTIKLYAAYQAKRGGDAFPPALMIMASYLDRMRGDVKNATGIYYEIPSVTVFANLRSLVGKKIKKIGVLHRPAFRSFVDAQAKLASIEGFEFMPVDVGNRPSARKLSRAVTKLRKDNSVDAIWVLNDNALLSKKMIGKGWLPGLRKNQTPVVVGVGALVSPTGAFGSFAVLPDHVELGIQAGNMLLEIADEDWAVEEGVALPIAVKTQLHVGFARKFLKFDEAQLERIDRVVE